MAEPGESLLPGEDCGPAAPVCGHTEAADCCWHVLGGAGVSYVVPVFESNRAFTTTLTPAAAGRPATITHTDFDFSYDLAPRAWLGFVAEGDWGGRVSYWHYDQSARAIGSLSGTAPPGSSLVSASPAGIPPLSTPTLLLAPGNADVLAANSTLKLDVFDLEGTKGVRGGPCSFLVSAGARVARIDNRYDADLSNTANNNAVLAEQISLRSGQRFVGAGPTAALEAHCALAESELGQIGLYGSTRASFLFGNYHQTANLNDYITAAGVRTVTPLVVNQMSRNAAVPEAEVELGAEWSGVLWGIRSVARIGVVAQNYFGVLNNNNTTSGFSPGANGLNGDLAFFGLTAAVGLSY